MKDLRFTYLLDFYSNILSKKQRQILEMYYQDDMSLSEIAEQTNMTRQGVHDNIKRAEKEIISMEDKLSLSDRFLKIQSSLEIIENKLKSNNLLDENTLEELKKIRNLI